MSGERALRLVPFDPSYEIGRVLVKDSQDKLDSPESISAALSLIFQHPNKCDAYFLHSDDAPLDCALDYDHEDKSPTELFVRFKDQTPNKELLLNAIVRVRFEIFRQCYEFETRILAIDNEPEKNPLWHVIIATPATLLSYKQRRLPRVIIDKEDQAKLPECRLVSDQGAIGSTVRISELGMLAVSVHGSGEELGSARALLFGEHTVAVKKVRQVDDCAIYNFCFNSFKEFGTVFEAYRRIAYPHLRPRSDYTEKDLIELYVQTLYFSKFQTQEQTEARKVALEEVWSESKLSQHEHTADYVTVDQSGDLAGASSCSFAFIKAGRPLWIFHQLCAKASPDLLEQSGELYTWRAEYLAGRPEDLDVGVWFDSKSRWLERIYVKFALHKSRVATLFPVSVVRRNVRNNAKPPFQGGSCIAFGRHQRHMLESHGIVAGANPTFLNASGILDAALSIQEDSDTTQIDNILASVCTAIGASNHRFEITRRLDQVEGFQLQSDDELLTDVDRFCHFAKTSLVDFIASVEHSIAVTEKKKARGDGSEAN